ncbi:hypothetical protein Eyrgjafa_gp_24 [Pelagibacter phage Eyrgjafa EXVC018P]|jgi:hypothetical protein|uniref:Internal virion protein n=1 Tax=Pelagibacter phage Eyrgjafa EXVC018P TaxID=2736227 RepID=A0A7S5YDI0_9CAUD|nr:hypothetical protein Eyrgjafa_gp_24 [Pelagibacter phage Eyrgjafa EXVC018P]QLF88229.1 hypothetical protein Gjalp_gp37 [Pelagibacter phage Gjalp EXVC020P]
MCEPTTTTMLLASTVASSAIQYQQAKQEQKNAQARQRQQNDIARRNALQRYASEQLKIRQVAKQSSQKGFEASLRARKARAEFITTAGSSGIALSGSTNALLADFYRTEGNYKASLTRNMDINISQFERNMEAIQFGQEAQSTYVQAPNPAMLFASSALNVANTYYGLEFQKEQAGLMTNRQKKNYGNSSTTTSNNGGYI